MTYRALSASEQIDLQIALEDCRESQRELRLEVERLKSVNAETSGNDLLRFQATLQIYCARLPLEWEELPPASVLAKCAVHEADEILAALGIVTTKGEK